MGIAPCSRLQFREYPCLLPGSESGSDNQISSNWQRFFSTTHVWRCGVGFFGAVYYPTNALCVRCVSVKSNNVWYNSCLHSHSQKTNRHPINAPSRNRNNFWQHDVMDMIPLLICCAQPNQNNGAFTVYVHFTYETTPSFRKKIKLDTKPNK